jgi:uracil-DNA glycosylase
VTKVLILGEAKGANEVRYNSSFVGPSGVELLRQLDEAGVLALTSEDKSFISKYYNATDPMMLDAVWQLHADEIFRTNVLQFHPHGNDLKSVCGTKAEGIPGRPPIIKSGYLLAKFEPELDRLADEILHHDPNLIIALGNTALWALTGQTGVAKLRGTTLYSTHTVGDFKLLPTYHPAAVLRQWELRPTTIMDLIKAAREAEFPEIRRPNCEIWIEPSLEEITDFISRFVKSSPLLSVDIETSGDRITCIGFAPSTNLAIVIPFDDKRKPKGCYWPTPQHERQCWEIIRRVLEDGTIPKVFQNGNYDINFLYRSYGIRTFGAVEDTMLLHHARQPESLKGLGYLGSIYTDHGSWKHMRAKHETVKREE